MAVGRTAAAKNQPDQLGEFEGKVKLGHSLPSEKEVERAGKIEVLDREGKLHTFRELVAGSEGKTKVLVVFIRHFFCGLCQEYVRTISQSIPPAELPPDTEIIVVGCGEPTLIAQYAEVSGSQFPIYADPSRKLYAALGMICTLNLGDNDPNYIHQSVLKLSLKSVLQSLGSGRKMFSGGNYTQVGGEFLFERRQDGKQGSTVTWCHRMQNTRDHVEDRKLRSVLGLANNAGYTNGVTHETDRKRRWSVISTGEKPRRRLSKQGPHDIGAHQRKRMSWAGPIYGSKTKPESAEAGGLGSLRKNSSAQSEQQQRRSEEGAFVGEHTTGAAFEKLTALQEVRPAQASVS